jgi:hypothetical protein
MHIEILKNNYIQNSRVLYFLSAKCCSMLCYKVSLQRHERADAGSPHCMLRETKKDCNNAVEDPNITLVFSNLMLQYLSTDSSTEDVAVVGVEYRFDSSFTLSLLASGAVRESFFERNPLVRISMFQKSFEKKMKKRQSDEDTQRQK